MAEKVNTKGITVKKSEDMPEWYTQVVLKSELADYSAVKGCAVIRPLGYALWQGIMDFFNARIEKIGVQNAYFPVFIPESFFHKEADHVEGFAPEVAWIERKSEHEERVAIRPTSETIMYDSYSRWIRSHRDLPLRINQWCNIVRWEVKDVKLFLRSREFLWQEGHCVYVTKKETDKEVLMMIKEYQHLSHELLAVPAMIGLKSQAETFPGAQYTYTIESFMPDGKALQCGTSHNLGQGFAKSFGISYRGEDEQEHTPWQSSWGFSTRLIGGLIMTHGDDKGLVLPPRIAPLKVVIVPITKKSDPSASMDVVDACETLAKTLTKKGIKTHFDDREEVSPGFKYNEWELKGVPLRIELGPRDLEQKSCVVVKRNDGVKEVLALDAVVKNVPELLERIHKELFDKAQAMVDEKKILATNYNQLKKGLEERKLVLAHHCGDAECEDEIKTDTTGGTTRCRPYGEDSADKKAFCVRCGKKAEYKIYFAKNY